MRFAMGQDDNSAGPLQDFVAAEGRRARAQKPVVGPAEVDAELHNLCEALVQAEGRL